MGLLSNGGMKGKCRMLPLERLSVTSPFSGSSMVCSYRTESGGNVYKQEKIRKAAYTDHDPVYAACEFYGFEFSIISVMISICSHGSSYAFWFTAKFS